MKNPRVEIDLSKIWHNTKEVVKKCSSHNINIMGVTKVLCGDIDAARAMAEGGVSFIADSRIKNIVNLSMIPLPKILLRIPMQSEISEIVKYCDYSLNSEVETISMLSCEALRQGKVHKIILMVDLGDLREGIWFENYDESFQRIAGLKGIEIAGIGTNLTCYGGVIPSKENLTLLSNIADQMRKKYSISLPIVSGGNSSSLHLLDKGSMPSGINNLRIGEAVMLGRETAFGQRIHNMHDDACIFYGEIVEIKHKPSKPIGEIGMDAFGNTPQFEDIGPRYRAIIAAGRQDIDFHGIYPVDDYIKVKGASSDHLILDITECKDRYSVGDEIPFKMSYGCLLRSMTSPYVEKIKLNIL